MPREGAQGRVRTRAVGTAPLLLRVLAVAAPGLVLAGAGLTHPRELTTATAHHWWTLHVWLLPLFPLLAVVIWTLVRGESGVVAWMARIAAYGYAVFYTGLDTVTGIAAGVAADTDPSGHAADRLIRLGNQLAIPGIWSYLIAVALTGIVSVRRDGTPALPGALIIVGAAIPFYFAHIYWPIGVLAMVGTAIGAAALEIARRGAVDPAAEAPAIGPATR